MKKLFSVLMVASVLSLVACKGNKTEETAPAVDSTTMTTPEATPEAMPVDTTMPADTTAHAAEATPEHK